MDDYKPGTMSLATNIPPLCGVQLRFHTNHRFNTIRIHTNENVLKISLECADLRSPPLSKGGEGSGYISRYNSTKSPAISNQACSL